MGELYLYFKACFLTCLCRVGDVKKSGGVMGNCILIKTANHVVGLFFGSSGFWSDKFCRLCLEFEAMSHGGTERTEDY